jgi:hypothetical protein
MNESWASTKLSLGLEVANHPLIIASSISHLTRLGQSIDVISGKLSQRDRMPGDEALERMDSAILFTSG